MYIYTCVYPLCTCTTFHFARSTESMWEWRVGGGGADDDDDGGENAVWNGWRTTGLISWHTVCECLSVYWCVCVFRCHRACARDSLAWHANTATIVAQKRKEDVRTRTLSGMEELVACSHTHVHPQTHPHIENIVRAGWGFILEPHRTAPQPTFVSHCIRVTARGGTARYCRERARARTHSMRRAKVLHAAPSAQWNHPYTPEHRLRHRQPPRSQFA